MPVMHVCTYACVHAFMYVHICTYIYICVCVSMHVGCLVGSAFVCLFADWLDVCVVGWFAGLLVLLVWSVG